MQSTLTPCQTMIDAMQDVRRFQRFIETLPVTDDTNRLYRQCADMITELWDAWEFLFTTI